MSILQQKQTKKRRQTKPIKEETYEFEYDEANSNNELINLNLQASLAPRQEACKQFNEYFGLTGDKAIKVKVRSDLHNLIKETESVIMNDKEEEVEDYE